MSDFRLRVIISVGSRFHGFDLARELDRRGSLERLFTGYPRYSHRRFGLPKNRMTSLLWYEVLNRLYFAGVHRGLLPSGWGHVHLGWFDRRVAARLRPGADVFVGFSGGALHSMRRARSLGMVTVLERGSAHIQWQRRVLEAESQRVGVMAELPSAASIAHEMREYDEADYIAVPSAFAARTFVEQGISGEKLLVNPYGVDLSRFSPAARPQAEPSKPLEVLHVGRVSIQKGVHHLIEAVAQCPGARLTLVGGIDRGMQRWLLRPNVTAIGAVPGLALPQYYERADVFALLSIQEGFGMVIAQAMAMGLPVVVTRNSAAESLLRDGEEGLIVPPGDPAAAARAFVALQDPQLRHRLGEAARRRVQAGFSWADYGERALEHYRCVVRRRRTETAS